LSVPGVCYQVDAFVTGWKVEPSADGRGNLAEYPNVPKFSLIFRRGLQIELRQALKNSTLFAICWELFGALPKVAPRRTGGNKPI
jgi:hypothetical protein